MLEKDTVISFKKSIPLFICVLILSLSILIASIIFSNAILNRPLNASFSGSISDGYTTPDIMDIDILMGYLGIYSSAIQTESYETYSLEEKEPISTNEYNYDEMNNRLKEELENNILNGNFPEFPYIKMNGKLYFSKQAVDEWFFTHSKDQISVD